MEAESALFLGHVNAKVSTLFLAFDPPSIIQATMYHHRLIRPTRSFCVPAELVTSIVDEVAEGARFDSEWRKALRSCALTSRLFYQCSRRHIFSAAFSFLTFRRRRRLVDGERLQNFYHLVKANPILLSYVEELRVCHEYGTNSFVGGNEIVPWAVKASPKLKALVFSADSCPWREFSDALTSSLLTTFRSDSLTSLRLQSVADIPPVVFTTFANLRHLDVRYVNLNHDLEDHSLNIASSGTKKISLEAFSFYFATDVALLIMILGVSYQNLFDFAHLRSFDAQLLDFDAVRAASKIITMAARSLEALHLEFGDEPGAPAMPNEIDLQLVPALRTLELSSNVTGYHHTTFLSDSLALLHLLPPVANVENLKISVIYSQRGSDTGAMTKIMGGDWWQLDSILGQPAFSTLRRLSFAVKLRTRGESGTAFSHEWVEQLWESVRQQMPTVNSSPTLNVTYSPLDVLYL